MDVKAKRARLEHMVDWRYGDVLMYLGENKKPDPNMLTMFVSWVGRREDRLFQSVNLTGYDEDKVGQPVPYRSAAYWTLYKRHEA